VSADRISTASNIERITVIATAAPAIPATTSVLRRLYVTRFAFAVVWAAVMFTTASHLGPLAVTLLVLYPLFDMVAALVDARSSRTTGSVLGLHVNVAVSLLTTIGVAIACASGIPAVLRVWGAWAVVAGVVQLIVAANRLRMGGQWPMIISGAISALAGTVFIVMAGADNATLTNVAGYAIPGGIFFLVSALRLGRTAKTS
jgi:uncharacterized membrane protein HdeD (DUF308 family)